MDGIAGKLIVVPVVGINFVSRVSQSFVPTTWSLVVLLTLAVILAGSWVMFRVLARQSLDQRHLVAMREWGQSRGFRYHLRNEDEPLPTPLEAVSKHRLAVQICLVGTQAVLIRFESFGPPDEMAQADAPWRGGVWNLLIREIETEWPPTGLRPVASAQSALDLFSLSSFPLLGSAERFMLYGTDTKAAAIFSRSKARGLLPVDVGLLLHGRRLILDFSGRPFDSIEFDRMLALAEQLVGHLPGPKGN